MDALTEEESFSTRRNRAIFNAVITWGSRALILRDRLLGRVGQGRLEQGPDLVFAKHRIASGEFVLDAVFMGPAGPVAAVLLICHGIGETVEHWIPVQRLLAANGVASLVFDYAGYGRSTGRFSAAQAEADAVCAFRFLEELVVAGPVSLLGFSLGSGIAAAVVARVPANRLILGAAFVSFREAAYSLGIPKWLEFLIAPVWDTGQALRDCALPVLIVHGEKDRLFPVRMAVELKACCGGDSELIVVPGLEHNQPFYRPDWAYWGRIANWVAQDAGAETRGKAGTGAPAIHLS